MDPVLTALRTREGRYGGHGIDHEDQPFYGELDLYGILDQLAVGFHYRAVGIDDRLLHEERSWIAASPEGGLALWTIGSNARVVLRHDLIADGVGDDGERVLTFRLGEPHDVAILRIEVTFALFDDGRIGYRHAWGRAGEPFADRAWVSLALVD